MLKLSFSEENYLKAIYNLLEKDPTRISTNSIAATVETAPASVTDMVRKLAGKKLVNYEKYQGVTLTSLGRKSAISVIRKHRLWETFLTDKLGFNWDEVHEIAEQLEHIQSESLVQRLYDFLGKPRQDPHGDPIPDENGNFQSIKSFPLSIAKENEWYRINGVIDHRKDFLKYLDKHGLSLGKKISVKEITEYDQSMKICIGTSKNILLVSADVSKNILVSFIRQ